MVRRIIVIDARDNVATATEDLEAKDVVEVGGRGRLEVLQDIPFGHKLALCCISRGCQVVKYGEVMGTATRDIAAGEHVHVHNVESTRGRGDMKGR